MLVFRIFTLLLVVAEATVISRRFSLDDLPNELIGCILEHDEYIGINLARCNRSLHDLVNKHFEQSVSLANSLSMPSLKYIPPHSDFKVFEGLKFDTSPTARYLSMGLVSLAAKYMFGQHKQAPMLFKAIAGELSKLFLYDREEFIHFLKHQEELRDSCFINPLIQISMLYYSTEQMLALLSVLDEFPHIQHRMRDVLILSKEGRALLRQSPTIFEFLKGDYYFTRDKLGSLLDSGASLDDILFIFHASGLKDTQMIKILLEICCQCDNNWISRPEVASILVGFYEYLSSLTITPDDLPLLFTCMRLRGIINIDEHELPLELMDGTAIAAIIGNRYDYLMKGIEQRMFTLPDNVSDEFYRNQAMIDFFKPLCMTDPNVHHFVFDVMKLDKKNDEILLLKTGYTSFLDYVRNCDYNDFSVVVLPIARIKGIYNCIPEIMEVIRSADNEDDMLLDKLIQMCIHEADIKRPEALTLIKAVLEAYRYSPLDISFPLGAESFMFMFRDQECRALLLELKRAGKEIYFFEEEELQKLLHNDKDFRFLAEHAEEAYELDCFFSQNVGSYVRFSPLQVQRLMVLTEETIEEFCRRELSDTDYYRYEQFNSYLFLYAYINMWNQSQNGKLLKDIKNEDHQWVDLIDLDPLFQGMLLFKLLAYMSPERLAVTRLALAYLARRI